MRETISLIGFSAPERGEFENDAALDLLGSVGAVIDVYPNGMVVPDPTRLPAYWRRP